MKPTPNALKTIYVHLKVVLISNIVVSGLNESFRQGEIVLQNCLVTDCFWVTVEISNGGSYPLYFDIFLFPLFILL